MFLKISGTFSGGPHNKHRSIWGSILGSPYFGKLPNMYDSCKYSVCVYDYMCVYTEQQQLSSLLLVSFCEYHSTGILGKPLGYLIFSLMALIRDPIY